jgi:ribulose-phosphate 3-epimerase
MAAIVKTFDPSIIDLLHLDVMDGNFVPNITFGPGYAKALKAHTAILLDVHLMIENPEKYVDAFAEAEPWCITFHYEATRFSARLLQKIRDLKIKSAVALNPSTPVESVFDIAVYADMILIMSVEPGFYGQKFMPGAINKIEKLKTFLADNKLNTLIQIDGGINSQNIRNAVSAGADIIVAGGSAFVDGLVNENIKKLLQNI